MLHIDEASTKQGTIVGMVFTTRTTYVLKVDFITSNNKAIYKTMTGKRNRRKLSYNI